MRFFSRIAIALIVAALWAPSSANAACGDGAIDGTDVCDDGSQCADGTDCTSDAGLCSALPDPACAPVSNDGCSDDCLTQEIGWDCPTPGQPCTPICGDGNVVGEEECDDTGESATCDADCTTATCGDGTTNATANEDCDDAGETATCDRDCTNVACNDGTVNIAAGENCDDGNNSNNDGCAGDCSAIESGWGCPTPGQACIAEMCTDCSLLLTDDFGDDLVDPSKWIVDTTNTDADVVETNQHLEITNGGLLISEYQLEPIVSGSLSLVASWTIGALDDVSVFTRASLAAGASGKPEPAVRSYASEEFDTIGVEIAGGASDTAALTIAAGDELLFEIVDDGDNINLIVTNVTQASTSATAGIVLPDRHAESYVAFQNRIKAAAVDYTSAVDSVAISTLNNFPCKSHGCDVTTQTCADVNFIPGVTCDDRNTNTANDACDGFGACRGVPLTCGDGVVDTGEQCDDGTGNNSDTVPNACRTSCVSAHCGDTVVDLNEQCDAGYLNSDTTPDTCRQSCRNPRCGDGVIDATVGAGEVCDDANRNANDGCAADCSAVDPGWDCSASVLERVRRSV